MKLEALGRASGYKRLANTAKAKARAKGKKRRALHAYLIWPLDDIRAPRAINRFHAAASVLA